MPAPENAASESPAPASDPLARVRALCTALPEVTEKISHGEPTWFVRRVFVTYAERHHDDRVGFWCAAPPGAQEALVSAHPERYFRPPYVGGRGWLGVRLDVEGLDWAEIAEIITDAYRQIAPKKLLAHLDAPLGAVDPAAREGSAATSRRESSSHLRAADDRSSS